MINLVGNWDDAVFSGAFKIKFDLFRILFLLFLLLRNFDLGNDVESHPHARTFVNGSVKWKNGYQSSTLIGDSFNLVHHSSTLPCVCRKPRQNRHKQVNYKKIYNLKILNLNKLSLFTGIKYLLFCWILTLWGYFRFERSRRNRCSRSSGPDKSWWSSSTRWSEFLCLPPLKFK